MKYEGDVTQLYGRAICRRHKPDDDGLHLVNQAMLLRYVKGRQKKNSEQDLWYDDARRKTYS